jgi:hypothetical protein
MIAFLGVDSTQSLNTLCGLRGKAHTPKVIQGRERFKPNFPQAVDLQFANPYNSKPGCLLRKTVCKYHFSAYL